MGNVELYKQASKQASPILGLREKGIENKGNVLAFDTSCLSHVIITTKKGFSGLPRSLRLLAMTNKAEKNEC